MKYLHTSVKKPWGSFRDFAEKRGTWHLKILVVRKGKRLSLQKHSKRSEVWIVAEGRVRIVKNKTTRILGPQQAVRIEKEEPHRIEALQDAVIVEVTFGLHNEEDLVRLADDYGRVLTPDRFASVAKRGIV